MSKGIFVCVFILLGFRRDMGLAYKLFRVCTPCLEGIICFVPIDSLSLEYQISSLGHKNKHAFMV